MKIKKSEIYLLSSSHGRYGLDDYHVSYMEDSDALYTKVYDYDKRGDENSGYIGELTATAGKTCYNSFHPSLNKNLNKTRKNIDESVRNLIKQGHHSVLEHGSVTIGFKNISLIVTHELVRHRVGTAYSQKSGRYVRENELSMVDIKGVNEEVYNKMIKLLNHIESEYKSIEEMVFNDIDDKDMKTKKEMTSELRRILPSGQCTNIIVTANHRAWRHILKLRTSSHAEREMREVMKKVKKILKTHFPIFYEDIK